MIDDKNKIMLNDHYERIFAIILKIDKKNPKRPYLIIRKYNIDNKKSLDKHASFNIFKILISYYYFNINITHILKMYVFTFYICII